jgi:hypothetical protein
MPKKTLLGPENAINVTRLVENGHFAIPCPSDSALNIV